MTIRLIVASLQRGIPPQWCLAYSIRASFRGDKGGLFPLLCRILPPTQVGVQDLDCHPPMNFSTQFCPPPPLNEALQHYCMLLLGQLATATFILVPNP